MLAQALTDTALTKFYPYDCRFRVDTKWSLVKFRMTSFSFGDPLSWLQFHINVELAHPYIFPGDDFGHTVLISRFVLCST